MILLKYVYNMRIYSVERTRGRCEDNHYHGEKYRQDATTFYTEKRSTVLIRLTNFKTSVSQLMSAVLRQSV